PSVWGPAPGTDSRRAAARSCAAAGHRHRPAPSAPVLEARRPAAEPPEVPRRGRHAARRAGRRPEAAPRAEPPEVRPPEGPTRAAPAVRPEARRELGAGSRAARAAAGGAPVT